MKFKKGQSGNKSGRPRGAKNKAPGKLREIITDFLEDNFEKIKADFKKLSPKDRSRLYCDLLQYGVPKLQAVTNTFNLESMTDEQLDMIMDKIKNSATHGQD